MSESDEITPRDVGRIELSAPATMETLDLVHAELEELWRRLPQVGDRDRIRFETGVIEILGNIVEHAFLLGGDPAQDADLPPLPGRRLEIDIEVSDERLTAVFGDNGMPVAVDLSAASMPDEDAESGRGLALALAALDDLGYERVDGRNRWTLLCARRDE